MAGKSEVVCSARVAISSRESPRTRTPSAFEERAGHLDQAVAAPVAGGLADRVAMRIEAVQQRRLHRAAPDLPLVEAAGADVRPGLDGRSRSAARSISTVARLVEGDAPADQVVGDAGLDRRACAPRRRCRRCGPAPRRPPAGRCLRRLQGRRRDRDAEDDRSAPGWRRRCGSVRAARPPRLQAPPSGSARSRVTMSSSAWREVTPSAAASVSAAVIG